MSEPVPKDGADEALLELLIAHELEEFAAKPKAERNAELAAIGHDQGKIDAAVAKALRDAGLPPLGALAGAPVAVAPEPRATEKVVSLSEVRARKGQAPRWVGLLAAAAAVAVLGKGSVDKLTQWEPLALTYPTHVPAPTAHQLAEVERRSALRLCVRQLWGECLEQLDEAKAIDPAGDDTPEIQKARKQIEQLRQGIPSDPELRLESKPTVAPGERPLRRTPKAPPP